MATIEKNLEIANLVCKFGENNLLDLYKEVIEPSFFKEKFRKAGKSTFYFDQVSLTNLGKDTLGEKDTIAITGRFIKKTILEREQYIDNFGNILRDKQNLPSAPSAIFTLILNNHRLLYAAETKYAPTIDNFRSTLIYFLRNEQMNYHKSLPKEEGVDFLKRFPIVELTITPLTNQQSLKDNIYLFDTLKKVSFILNDRNSEIDGEDMFRQMQETLDDANGQGKFEITNKKGLNKEVIADEARKATMQGNQTVVLDGVDINGNKLRIKNDDIKIRRSIQVIQNNIKATVSNMFLEFKNIILSKEIRVKETDVETQKLIDNIEKLNISSIQKEEYKE
ncbi:hypothetical protein [Acinetobacter pollinis]|uniref:DUF4747 family protein n=1 Tax=Acinetobacter pollinis TaxID=2605270 RepID=A0ABU6DQH6_9GAMM|nr:hypothetical protein [Acinetobacter pollinis]MEB5475686.1 hypothetical protein [Acinetobacter pollinis]